MSVENKLLCSKLRGQCIAVIDSKDDVYQDLCKALSPAVNIIHFADQAEALASIQENQQQHPPNLILINSESIDAPHIHFDGFEISQDIKQMEAFQLIQPVPVVLFGLELSPAQNHQFVACSADAAISSPFNQLSLLHAISKLPVYRYVLEE